MCPGWDRGLGENEYIYMYGGILLFFTWNYDNIVSGLYLNEIKKFKVKKNNYRVKYKNRKRKKKEQRYHFADKGLHSQR